MICRPPLKTWATEAVTVLVQQAFAAGDGLPTGEVGDGFADIVPVEVENVDDVAAGLPVVDAALSGFKAVDQAALDAA